MEKPIYKKKNVTLEELEQAYDVAYQEQVSAERMYIDAYNHYLKCKHDSDHAFYVYVKVPSHENSVDYNQKNFHTLNAIKAEDAAKSAYHEAHKNFKKISKALNSFKSRVKKKPSESQEEKQPE
ncbi:MAG: hypothetical protein IKB06_02465 [Clostridia bacterium]|nr:hypothetical protein [Clostridia bacterium]